MKKTVLVFAARYAHTRQTSAAFVVVQAILHNWDLLQPHTKKQLIREAKEEAEYNLTEWGKITTKDNK